MGLCGSSGLDGLDSEVGHLSPHPARHGGALDVIALVNLQAVGRLEHGRPLHQVQWYLRARNTGHLKGPLFTL